MSALLHLRLTVPADLTVPVLHLLTGRPGVTNLTHLPGACLEPVGDVVEADVAREVASDLVARLRGTGLGARGGIVLDTHLATPFDRAAELVRDAPGEGEDTVLWDAVVDEADTAGTPTVSFFVFLLLATMLAAVAVITDSPVLVVGAMVVGPDFGPVAAICAGLVLGRAGLAHRAALLLLGGFAVAVALTAVLAWVAMRTGALAPDVVGRPRPMTGFIWRPDRWSLVVALIAGAAGVLAVATEKSSAMVGVFISVTTVPAAGALALGLAAGDRAEVVGSLAQLGLNLAGMVLAGVSTLLVLRVAWHRLAARAEAAFWQGTRHRVRRRAGARPWSR